MEAQATETNREPDRGLRRPTLGPVRNFGGAGELGVVSADVLKNAERRHVELEMVAPAPAARRGVTYSHTNLLNGFSFNFQRQRQRHKAILSSTFKFFKL